MTYSILKPSLRLEKYVQYFWEGDFQRNENQLLTHYDQAHFNHDFKIFTWYNPKEYMVVNSLST